MDKTELISKAEECEICQGSGLISNPCPKCGGSGRFTKGHLLTTIKFPDYISLLRVDNNRGGILVRNGEEVEFRGIYFDEYRLKELKCSSKWYMSRWG